MKCNALCVGPGERDVNALCLMDWQTEHLLNENWRSQRHVEVMLTLCFNVHYRGSTPAEMRRDYCYCKDGHCCTSNGPCK